MARRNGARGKQNRGSSDKEHLGPSGKIWRPQTDNDKYTVHSFRNLRTIFAITPSVTGQVLGGSYIALDQLSNYSMYTALFDQYRIDCVEVIFNLNKTLATNEQFPRLTVFPDFDDAGPPATLQNAQSHPRAVTHVFTPTRPTFSIKFTPRLAVATYGAVSSIYGTNDKAMYIDSQSPNAQHFGYKYAVENMWTGGSNIDVQYRVWFTCRNPV